MSTRSLGLWTALVGGLAALLAFYSVHASLPENALVLPMADTLQVRTWLPQGWGYFSGEARQELVTAYVRAADGGWNRVEGGHQGSIRYRLGLNRAGRLGEQEIALVESRATGEPADCRGDETRCLEEGPISGKAANPSPHATLCGDVGLVRRPPLPWAWAGSTRATQMPATVRRLEVSCSND